MNGNMSFHPIATAAIEPGGFLPDSGLRVGGHFDVECYDRDGNLRWADRAKNGVTDAAINNVLDVYLRSGSQTGTWYLSLVDNSGFVAFASADTMASHAGWSEVSSSDLGNSTRPAWTPGAASGKAVTNGTTVDFSITAGSTRTIRGVFLTSANDKGGTTGILFATAAFSGGNQTVNNGDTLKVTYTVSGSST
jgi:hypothetical protein